MSNTAPAGTKPADDRVVLELSPSTVEMIMGRARKTEGRRAEQLALGPGSRKIISKTERAERELREQLRQ